VLGSAGIEGPVISWVADHRKHGAFAAVRGDPHSARVDYAPDLLADPVMRLVDRLFAVWAIGGLAVAFGLGYAIGATVQAGLTGLLWGGGVRLFVLHHVSYSINSIWQVFGRRRFATKDESRNVLWLSLFSFGESWHNHHHAFPTSARHGPRRWELDPSALVIRGLAACGLAWDVVGASRERQARKFAPGAT
jgi:stearoyl-CoA desaturase (Delta-9 desaturase)